MRRRPTASTLIACAALFFSLTGGAYAAGRYSITSKSQIKPNVLRQLRGAVGPQGPAGPQGAQGPQGETGPAGPAGTVDFSQEQTVLSAPAKLSTDMPSTGTVALCPAGDDVLNGGYTGTGDIVTQSFAKDPNEWAVSANLQPGADAGYVRVWVECVPVN